MRSANYVEETTTSIAGTSGDGAITLTSITNTPRFSTVFGTQATTIRYVIEDTVNKKFETGVGSVASNVLTRTLPQVTWDGTTYDDSTPAAVQFGSSPASGNIKIRMGATAESQGVVMAGRNNTVAGDTNWRDYPITSNVVWFGNGTSGTLTAGTEYYTCYELLTSGRLTGVQINVTTAVALAGVKLSLYSCSQTGLPGAKLLDFNNLSGATTGYKADTTTGTWSPAGPMYLTAGWYYVGFIVDQAIAVSGSSGNGAAHRSPICRQGGYGYSNTVSVAGNYATGLPSTPAPTTMLNPGSSSLAAPWVGLKVQA